MENEFYASDLCLEGRCLFWTYDTLNGSVVDWLKKNLRRKQYEPRRRYDYIIYTQYMTMARKYKRLKIGVKIYAKEDQMAFKLRWM